MTPPAGPDFLCIGMQKAGTGWLYDQLQFHPDFWMPPIKEFHYFDRSFPDDKLKEMMEMARTAPDRLARKRVRRNWRPLDDRDFAFFTDAEACNGQESNFIRYMALFRHKNGLLSGDITPAYSTLTEDLVAEIAAQLPKAKVILLLRDPVERVWSQISMSWRRGKFPAEILQDAPRFRSFLDDPQVRGRSFPTEIFHRWSRHIPKEQMRFFFLDDIIAEPERVRHEVLSFLGGDPGKPSGGLAASYNRKSAMEKLELTDITKQFLIEYLAPEIRACADLFGGPAHAWRERYRL